MAFSITALFPDLTRVLPRSPLGILALRPALTGSHSALMSPPPTLTQTDSTGSSFSPLYKQSTARPTARTAGHHRSTGGGVPLFRRLDGATCCKDDQVALSPADRPHTLHTAKQWQLIYRLHHIRFWYLRCCGCPGLRCDDNFHDR